MKHQTIFLVKFKTLARRLKQPLYAVVGCLESLWIFAQTQAKDGDLSRFDPIDIAAWIEWPGDENVLIDTLVACRWLDRTEDGRLLIHDWDDHKPNYLKGVAARRKGAPADESQDSHEEDHAPPADNPVGDQVADPVGDQVDTNEEPSTELGAEPSPQPSTPPPNLTFLPNQTRKNPLSPPSPPQRRGGGERARKRGSPRPGATAPDPPGTPPLKYPPRFVETWQLVERLAYASTPGSPERAFAVWRKLLPAEHDAVDEAWKNYTDSRRATLEKTEHFCNWLARDWRHHLKPLAINERLDPKQLAELADGERAMREKLFRDWNNAVTRANIANKEPPPKPAILAQPPKYYQLKSARVAQAATHGGERFT